MGLFRIIFCLFYLWNLSQNRAVILSGLPDSLQDRLWLLEGLGLSTQLPPPGSATPSYWRLLFLNPGFQRPEEVLTFRVSIPTAEVESNDDAALVYEQLVSGG